MFMPVAAKASLRDLYADCVNLLLTQGVQRTPAQHGPPGVLNVLEYMGYQGALGNPRSRLLFGNTRGYSPGQAAARWLFFLSGSDRRDQIEFYVGSLETYSADGVSLGGSAHGARIFQRQHGQSLLDRSIECLQSDGESNRAVIPFYFPSDAGCGHCDAPCAIAALPYRRGNTLHMSVHMRAQEVPRLFAYDIFEFTMLQEYMASALSLEVGVYNHSAFALQSIAREASNRQHQLLVENINHDLPPSMAPMPPVQPNTRRLLVVYEEQLRAAIGAGDELSVLRHLKDNLPSYWLDILVAAGAHACFRRKGRAALAPFETFNASAYPVTQLELLSLLLSSNPRREPARDRL